MEMETLSLPSWKSSLIPLLFPENLPPRTELPRIAIVGIGNKAHGDQAAGILVAQALQRREFAADAGRVLVVEACRAPENFAVELRNFKPQVIILIDAVQMELPAGEIAWIPWETATGLSSHPHNLPLTMLARYLMLEFGCSVHLLGIQPAQNDANVPISKAVQAAVDELTQAFCRMLFCH
jgi:hydrogenase 3 maturation protease